MNSVEGSVSKSELDILENDAERLKVLFEVANEGLFFMDNNRSVRFYNSRFYEAFNIDAESCSLEDWLGLVHEKDRDRIVEELTKAVKEKVERTSIEYEVRCQDGEYIWIEAGVKNVFDCSGKFLYTIGSHSDITERRRREENIKYLAYHDELTGLYNRNKIVELLDYMIMEGQEGYFIYVDLKNFRSINDVVNFEAGDIVLKAIGENMMKVLPLRSFLARNYGDEFMIIVKKLDSVEEDRLLEGLYDAIKTPVQFRNRTVEFDSRIGAIKLPGECTVPEEVIRKAQIMVSLMKDRRQTGISYYDDSLQNSHLRKLDVERCIMKALKNNEFYVKYQPIFDIKSGTTVGFEALLRWDSKDLGQVMPSEFISIAESTHVIHKLGYYVLEEACKFAQEINAHGIYPFISVNISALQLHADDFVEKALCIIKKTGAKTEQLLFEITESATLDSGYQVLEKLKELHSHGIGLSIDDFGTGYSSMNSIISLPISHLKVDRSLIQKICTNQDVMNLMEMLITFSHKANFKIVAEGIEDNAMLQKVEDINGDFGQGFLHSQPLLFDEIIELFHNGKLHF